MPKIKKEEIERINKKCKNQWKLDTEYFLFHSEKKLYKRIKLDDETFLQFDLMFNYRNEKTLHISKYYYKKDDYFAKSNGIGKFVKLADSQPRKNINDLIKMTSEFTDERLLQINAENEVYKNPLLVASEKF